MNRIDILGSVIGFEISIIFCILTLRNVGWSDYQSNDDDDDENIKLE